MKSIVTLSSLLFLATLAVGCASVDLDTDGGSAMSHNGENDILKQLADSSAGN